VDELPEREILPALRFLDFLKRSEDPFANVAVEDEELSPQAKARLEQAKAEVARGDVVTTEELMRELGLES
jgi:hypothetical protein